MYDADRIAEAASARDEQDLYRAQLDVFLDPHDPAVIEQAKKDGVPQSWIDAAQASPVYKMAMDWKVAFPLHPEYRGRQGRARPRRRDSRRHGPAHTGQVPGQHADGG